jgi:hypothetical protein
VAYKRQKYDWSKVRSFYEAGHSVRECQARFGFSNGAWHRALERGDVTSRSEPGKKPRGATRKAVAELSAAGKSQAGIARALGVSKPTVCFHMRMLGIPARVDFSRRYDWAKIRAYYESGHSFRECLTHFGFSRNAWADAIQRGAIKPRPRAEPLDVVLVAGRRRNRYHLKARLLAAGLKKPSCEICGLSEWRARPISLELHHVNGKHSTTASRTWCSSARTVIARRIHGAARTRASN